MPDLGLGLEGGDVSADGAVPAQNATEQAGPKYSNPAVLPPIENPKMGPAETNLITKWTAAGINTTISSNGEKESEDRFKLQKQLTTAVKEQSDLIAAMQPQANTVKANAIKWTARVDNVTRFLKADATAGGLVATSRSLMQQVPLTQKLLSKTMSTQLGNLASDTLVMKKTISETDIDYRQRIQAAADTVQSLFGVQDKKFSTAAQQQAAAMQQSANGLGVASSAAVSSLGKTASSAASQASKITATAVTGATLANSALSDAEDTLGGIQADFGSAVQDQVNSLGTTVNELHDSSVNQLGTQGDKTMAAVTTSAMAAGNEAARALKDTDNTASQLLSVVESTVASGTAAIAKLVEKSDANATRTVSQTGSVIGNQISEVQQKAALSLTDVMQEITDAKALMTKQGSTSAEATATYNALVAKLIPLMNSQFSSVGNQAKSVAGDVTTGAGGEMLHLNDIIASLTSSSGAKSGDLATQMAALLASSQKSQAGDLSKTQGSIDSQTNTLQTAMAGVSNSGIQRAGDLTSKAATIGNTLGGSVTDLMSTIADTTGSGSADMSAMAAGLGGQASSTFGSLVSLLRGMNRDGTDAKANFVSTLIGPASDSATQSFESMQTFLATLLGNTDGLANGQASVMTQLRAQQRDGAAQSANLYQTMKGVSGLNSELSNAVSAQGQQLLADARAKMAQDLRDAVMGLTGQSRDSLNTVDNLINGQSGPASSSTMDAVAKLLASSSANMDAVSRDFSQAEKTQLQSLTGLSAMAISMLGQSSAQGGTDKQQTEAALANARANLVAQFREIAANSTDTKVGATMLALSKAGNDTAIIKYLLDDVKGAMATINKDAAVGRDVNDRKNALFQSYVDAQEAELQKQQAAILVQLQSTIASVQNQLANKTQMLNGTKAEMEATLQEIRQKVIDAQAILGENLQLYQSKLAGIIGEIRSYMNLSSDADELAIRQDISNQLAKVNGTQIAIASANAAVSDKLASQQTSQKSAGSSSLSVVNDVIGGAIAMEDGLIAGHDAHTDNLIGVAAGIDSATGDLNGKLEASSNMIEAGIAQSASTVGSTMKRAETNSAKVIDQLNVKATDVASTSRKAYIRNLERMGNVDDDTAMVSKQLASLLGNSDSTIVDISDSVMSHLDLSSKTLASLNGAEARKVASVSDVMGAFTSVVQSFLNETGITMETVMAQLNAVEDGSKEKLGQMSTRSRDELNWVESNLNATSDSYALFLEQERAIQSAMRDGVQKVADKIALAPTSDQLNDINESMDSLKQSVGKTQADELSKVRAWISSRDPAVAKTILQGTPSASLVEQTRNDIRRRLRSVQTDMRVLANYQ